jgi:hypothetical protein
MSEQEDLTLFKWNQPAITFALTDLRRNWKRWLIWTLAFSGFVAALVLLFPSNPGRHPIDTKMFIPALIVGAFALRFFIAICRWPVDVRLGRIRLGGGGHAVQYLSFKKILKITFDPTTKPSSMLVRLKSGYEIQVFFDRGKVSTEKLLRFLQSNGILIIQ